MSSSSASSGWGAPPSSAAPTPAGTSSAASSSSWGTPPPHHHHHLQQPNASSGWASTTNNNNTSAMTNPLGRARSSSAAQKPSWDSVPGWSSNVVAPAANTTTTTFKNNNTGDGVVATGWGSQQQQQAPQSSGGGWATPQQKHVGFHHNSNSHNDAMDHQAGGGGWGSRPTTHNHNQQQQHQHQQHHQNHQMGSIGAPRQQQQSSGWGASPSPSASAASSSGWNSTAPHQKQSWNSQPTQSSTGWNSSPVPSSHGSGGGAGWNSSPVASGHDRGGSAGWNSSPVPSGHGTGSGGPGWDGRRPGWDAAPVTSSSSNWDAHPHSVSHAHHHHIDSAPFGSGGPTGWSNSGSDGPAATAWTNSNSDGLRGRDHPWTNSSSDGLRGREHPRAAAAGEDPRKDLRKAKSMNVVEQRSGSRLTPPSRDRSKGSSTTRDDHDSNDIGRKDGGVGMRLFNKSFAQVNKSIGVIPSDDHSKAVVRGQHSRSNSHDISSAIGVYVYGLPKWVRVPEILNIFGEYGSVVNVAIVSKPRKDQRAYAYVDYEVVGAAARAIDALKNKRFFDMNEPLELRPHFDQEGGSPPSSSWTTEPASEKRSEMVRSVVVDRKEFEATASSSSSAEAKSADAASASVIDYKTIHLGNVPQNVEKSELEKLFLPFGSVRRIHVVQRPTEKRAFAFVSFKTPDAARNALRALKDTKHFGMSEPLKADYSHADNRDQGRTKVSDRERPEREKTSATASSKSLSKSKTPTASAVDRPAAATTTTTKERKSGRTAIFIREVRPDQADDVRARFTSVGPLRSFHVVLNHDGSGHFGVAAFQRGEDAARAVKDKVVEGAVFPRQRRLTVDGIPSKATEEEVKGWFQTMGEVRRVELQQRTEGGDAAVGDETTAAVAASAATAEFISGEVEFVKGDVAIVALLHTLDPEFPGGGVRLKATYAASRGSREDHEHHHEGNETTGGGGGGDGAAVVVVADDVVVAGGGGGGGEDHMTKTSTTDDISQGTEEPTENVNESPSPSSHRGGDDYFGLSSSSSSEEDDEVVNLEDLKLDEREP